MQKCLIVDSKEQNLWSALESIGAEAAFEALTREYVDMEALALVRVCVCECMEFVWLYMCVCVYVFAWVPVCVHTQIHTHIPNGRR